MFWVQNGVYVVNKIMISAILRIFVCVCVCVCVCVYM